MRPPIPDSTPSDFYKRAAKPKAPAATTPATFTSPVGWLAAPACELVVVGVGALPLVAALEVPLLAPVEFDAVDMPVALAAPVANPEGIVMSAAMRLERAEFEA